MADLSDCAKSFIRFVTGRQRQQLKLLLQTYKQLIQIAIGSLVAKIVRMDIISQTFQNGINSINTLLGPIENQLAQLPFSEFLNCTQVAGTLGNLENLYFEKKQEYNDIVFKNAQFAFASTHANNLRNKLENELDIVDKMITYIDSYASLDLLDGDGVYVYAQEEDTNGNTYPITRQGTIQGTPAINVSVLMDDTGGVETFNATQIQTR